MPWSLSMGSTLRGSNRGSDDWEELVEVTLNLQEDKTIVLSNVKLMARAMVVASSGCCRPLWRRRGGQSYRVGWRHDHGHQ
ncbi:hypothetical protein GUJ93_ZPchr0011g28250 [Zizania palustris]|uniref:Uncharacterized protein n=1 Tax=Zizania palustris TaxID=103762 RepID=A0A8J5WHX4_ZIZPA|nr:hypothetical protein GUJ93_ZPchr0011g28250 [Zizania palustris]